jgi:hypothetical protein
VIISSNTSTTSHSIITTTESSSLSPVFSNLKLEIVKRKPKIKQIHDMNDAIIGWTSTTGEFEKNGRFIGKQ